jgi:dihydropteroate synthase
MGIINVTPDSFYQRSRVPAPQDAARLAREMLDQGADLLDVGAISSRPGAEEISHEEELNRISPVLEAIRGEVPEAIISVDTWRSGVAAELYRRFAIHMVNDISAGQRDPDMFHRVAEMGIPYIMMHMQGTPSHMQDAPTYSDVVDDLLQFFSERLYKLKKLGVNDVVIDPGFGFGKTLEQNYALLKELDAFRMLELPIMVGVSRKSMIYNVLGVDANHALNGTTAVHMAALLKGTSMLRVHDVQAAAETVQIFQQIVNTPHSSV